MAMRERHYVGNRDETSADKPSGARLVLRPASDPAAEHLSSFTRFARDGESGLGFVSPAAKDGPRVLLVDGDAHELARMLDPFADVTDADSTESALGIIDSGQVFDAIVSDLSLGGMSGITFFAYLSAMHPYLASRFIAVTSSSASDLDETFRNAIGNRLLMKPVAIDEMLLLLRDLSSPCVVSMEKRLSHAPVTTIATARDSSPVSAVVCTARAPDAASKVGE